MGHDYTLTLGAHPPHGGMIGRGHHDTSTVRTEINEGHLLGRQFDISRTVIRGGQ